MYEANKKAYAALTPSRISGDVDLWGEAGQARGLQRPVWQLLLRLEEVVHAPGLRSDHSAYFLEQARVERGCHRYRLREDCHVAGAAVAMQAFSACVRLKVQPFDVSGKFGRMGGLQVVDLLPKRQFAQQIGNTNVSRGVRVLPARELAPGSGGGADGRGVGSGGAKVG